MTINRIYKVLLFIIAVSLFFSPLSFCAQESQKIINIRVYPDKVINKEFYGFGAETLPWLWTKENLEKGVGNDDIRLNLERIRSMHLPVTRIFVPWETWNPSVDYKTFTWESDAMKSLYNTLDLYQQMGTQVILVTVDWLKDPPWKDSEASAGAVVMLLEHLVKSKGYNCIRFWTLTNEPELTYSWLNKLPYENYVRIHKLVKEALKRRDLRIEIVASDEVECREWFDRSILDLSETAGVFSSHLYIYPEQIYSIPDFFRERLNAIKKSSLSGKPASFFLCEFGFRGGDFGSCTNTLMSSYEYGLYSAMLCVEALNSGVDAVSLWCLYQVRLISQINPEGGRMMRIGLWAYKDENWKPLPIYYLYRLFTRYIKSGSEVLKTRVSDPAALKAACARKEAGYSLFIVNPTDKEQVFVVENKSLFSGHRRYVYDKTFSSEKESPLGTDTVNKFSYIRDKISPHSVVLYTNLRDD